MDTQDQIDDKKQQIADALGMMERRLSPGAVRTVSAIRFSGRGMGAHAYSTGNITFRALFLGQGMAAPRR